MFFWNSLAFLMIQRMLANLISGSSAIFKSSLNIWKFTVHVLLKPGLENFEHYFASMWASPDGSAGKESTCNAGDLGSIPALGRSPGEGNSYPLQYSGVENSMDCIVHGVTKSQTLLSNFHFHLLACEMSTVVH